MESGVSTSSLTMLSRLMEAGMSTSLVTFLVLVVTVPPPTAMYLYLLRKRRRTLGSFVTLVSVFAVSCPHCSESHRFSRVSGARVLSTSCCRDTEQDTEESERTQKKFTSECLTCDLCPQAQQAKVSSLSY